ncbi:hypothetical protein WDU94_005658 [Cyamophila willieti]
MKKWQTTLSIRATTSNNTTNIKSNKIKINTGIFQGDSLSTLLFCLCMNPLSTILNKNTKGFKIKAEEFDHYITHLFYVDDLKLFAETNDKLTQAIKTVEHFSKEIGMELGTQKCKIQAITKGKLTPTPEYTTTSSDKIEPMEPGEYYKYLGIEQNKNINQTATKSKLKKLFHQRLQKILKTQLNAKNLTRAINSYVIPVLTYSFGIIKWTTTDLNEIETLLRTTMTKYNRHHPKSSRERFTLPRKQGGRGIIDITCLHTKQINNMRKYFYEKRTESSLLRAITKADQNYTPLNLAQYESTRTSTEITNRNLQEKIEKWKTKSLHDMCRWCGNKSETTQHLMAGCTTLTQTDYTPRHDNMGKILHEAIENKIFSTEKIKGYWNYNPEPIQENQEYALYWNRTILTDRHVAHNRPDTVLWKKRKKTVHLIDYAVVNTHNITATYSEKTQKYQDLAMEIKEMWEVDIVKIHPIIISTTGIVPKTTTHHIKELDLPIQLTTIMQHSVVLSICNLFRKTLNK